MLKDFSLPFKYTICFGFSFIVSSFLLLSPNITLFHFLFSFLSLGCILIIPITLEHVNYLQEKLSFLEGKEEKFIKSIDKSYIIIKKINDRFHLNLSNEEMIKWSYMLYRSINEDFYDYIENLSDELSDEIDLPSEYIEKILKTLTEN